MARHLLLVILVAATCAAADVLPMAAVPPGPMRTQLTALEPAAQQRALTTLAKMPHLLADLDHVAVSPGGGLFLTNCYGTPPPPVAAAIRPAGFAADSVPIANVPAYSSRPGASRTLYLDFNGHVVAGTQWNAAFDVTSWNTRAFSMDGDYANFSDQEQEAIRLIWARIAEDFRPWDVNVTTVEPPAFGPRVGRLLFTDGTDADGELCPLGDTVGGLAYLAKFGEADYHTAWSPAWVYVDNLSGNESYIAEAGSHEFGHNLALIHDGTATLEYFGGHGPAAYSWGPIMGAGYDRTISQWSRGEYNGANNPEDDLAIIGGYLTWLADDHGDLPLTASVLPLVASGEVRTVAAGTSGIISNRDDVDLFTFSARAGPINLTVSPASVTSFQAPFTPGTNLDVRAEILDAMGNPVSGLLADPQDLASATITGSLPAAGFYHLSVRGAGNRNPLNDGFTSYGSIGSYTISGTVPGPPAGTIGFVGSQQVGYEGSAGPRTVFIPVTRSAGSGGTVSVDYATQDLSAVTPEDYAAISGTLTWVDGDALIKYIMVLVQGDLTEEADEAFVVVLSNPTGGANLTPESTFMVVLRNDDGASAQAAANTAAMIQPSGTGDSGPCGAGMGGLAGLVVLACGFLVRRRRA